MDTSKRSRKKTTLCKYFNIRGSNQSSSPVCGLFHNDFQNSFGLKENLEKAEPSGVAKVGTAGYW